MCFLFIFLHQIHQMYCNLFALKISVNKMLKRLCVLSIFDTSPWFAFYFEVIYRTSSKRLGWRIYAATSPSVRLKLANKLLFSVIFVCAARPAGPCPRPKPGEFCELLCQFSVLRRGCRAWENGGHDCSIFKMSQPANRQSNFSRCSLAVVGANRPL